MKTQPTPYHSPEDFPIPQGTDPVDTLLEVLSRTEGILDLLTSPSGDVIVEGKTGGYAIQAAKGLVMQAQSLVIYWNETDENQSKEVVA